MELPLTVQFNTHDEADTPVFEQGDNWEDNVVWDYTHSVPQANYQGQRVNFSQPTNSQLHRMIEIVNTSLYKYPQSDNLASAKSDTDIWNHINRYIWGKSGSQSSPKGNWSADPNAIVPRVKKNEAAIKQIISQGTGSGMSRQQIENIIEDFHGDDINLIHSNLISLGDSQARAKTHRDSIESKVQSHSHNNGGGTCKCNFWDIPCQMGCGIEKMIPYVLIGGVALLALRKK